MKAGNLKPGVRLRLVLRPDAAIGPGRADMLDAISATGSIAAAGRLMGMSYKRAWLLVEALNGAFRQPLVEAAKGGRAGGGAQLTPLGADVLKRYRRIEAAADAAARRDLRALRRALVPAAVRRPGREDA